jgi:prepilin-type N-terminal cleavage/methylation domain-containing protein
MKPKCLTGQDGFTILEVLVAMVILGMSLLLLLNMTMVALDGNDWSNNTTVATQLLQEKLEQLRSGTVKLESGYDSPDSLQRVWTVSDAGNRLKKVEVIVTWTDIRNNTVSNSMTTYIKTDSI